MQQSEYTQAQLEKAIENIIEGDKIVSIEIHHWDLTESTDFDTVKSLVMNFDMLQIDIWEASAGAVFRSGKSIGNIYKLNNKYHIEYIFKSILYTIILENSWADSTIEQSFRFIEEPLGIIKIWAGNEVPEGYHICDGTSFKRDGEYKDLFNNIGTTFNEAADCTGEPFVTPDDEFRIPDLRGRFIVGFDERRDTQEDRVIDSDYSALGSTGGEKKHKLTSSETGIPAHNHNAAISVDPAGSHRHKWFGDDQLRGYVDMIGGISGETVSGYDAHSSPTTDEDSRVYETSKPCNDSGTITDTHTHNVAISIENATTADAEESHENRPPYYTLMYIIKISN